MKWIALIQDDVKLAERKRKKNVLAGKLAREELAK